MATSKALDPPLIDHVGWQLWRANRDWQHRFRIAMINAGHPSFAEARGALVPYIDREGTRQSDLATRAGLTKQAVQQLVDGLESDGLVERRADPDDARARRVHFTRTGLRALSDANEVKRGIERDYRRRLGDAGFEALQSALAALVDDSAVDD